MREYDIVTLLRRREERGMEALQRHYAPLIRYIISPILTDARDREEAFSEALMRVWEKIDTYDEEKGSFTAWLTAIARNVALNHLRNHRTVDSTDALDEEIPSAEPTPEWLLLTLVQLQKLK